MSMERVRVEEFWRIKWWRLWMSQSFFSLGFLTQNSLWKLSTFRGYKGIYSSVCEECEKSGFIKIGHYGDSTLRLEWVASLSHELTAWPDCIFLSSSAPTVVTLQFPTCFTRVPLWRLASCKIQLRDSFDCLHLEFSSHSLTHNPYIIHT